MRCELLAGHLSQPLLVKVGFLAALGWGGKGEEEGRTVQNLWAASLRRNAKDSQAHCEGVLRAVDLIIWARVLPARTLLELEC